MKRRYQGESLQFVEMLCTDKIEFGGNITSMNTREQIHALSEEMLENLGKLVAVDSSLAPRQRGNLSEKDRQRHLRSGLKLPESLVLKP